MLAPHRDRERKASLSVSASMVVRWSRTALLAATLLIGFAQICELPPFEGFDEIAHYSYIQQVAETASWPHFDDPLSAEIDEYLQVAPSSSSLQARWSYSGFFASPANIIDMGRIAVYSNRDGSRAWLPGSGANWQAQHPPLYYLVMAPFYKLSKNWSLAAQLLFLRGISYFVAWIALCLASFSMISRSQSPLIASALILAPALWPFFFPMWFPEMARLGNDSLVILLAACACLALKKLPESDANIFRYAVLGVLFGLGLLTKATFFPFAVVTAGFLGLQTWQARGISSTMNKRAYGLMVFVFVIGVISGWWYLGKYIETGSALGSNDAIFLNQSGGLLKGLGHNASFRKVFIDWPSFLASSFVWVGTWSFVRWPPMSLLPLITMIWLFAAGYIGAVRRSDVHAKDCLPALTFAALLFALFNHSLVFIAAYGAVGGAGYYLHSFLPILVPLVGYGLARTVAVRETHRVIFVLALYPAVFLPAMLITQGLFFAGCELRHDEHSPIDTSLLLNCLANDLSGRVKNLSTLSYPWLAISFFFFGWFSMVIGLIGSIYALWSLRTQVKSNMIVLEASPGWRPHQLLRRLVGPHIGFVKAFCIAVVGALIGGWLLRQWGLNFGTSRIVGFVIQVSIGAVLAALMARLIKPGAEGFVDPPEHYVGRF
jgi:uncharacterized membrane protein YeaQ/YmgE (transglycosylase-associated protein family)